MSTIKNWSDDDKPREKLIAKGGSVLSDTELLTIIIGSGTIKKSAFELAKEILKSVDNNWHNLSKLSIKDLMKFKGIGVAKAITIYTVLEIARRKNLQAVPIKETYNTPNKVFDLLQPIIGHSEIEEFWILCLNNSHKLIHYQRLSLGAMTFSAVDIRLVFKIALEKNSTAIIVAHNHPSGILKPSESDINITEKIKNASELLSITLLDHVIITYENYFSIMSNI